MRLWSIHPRYLDTKGLVAVWRKGLLALNVLKGNTVGYRNHPQLDRFKASQYPIDNINYYLAVIWDEATFRGYSFDATKIGGVENAVQIPVTLGQVCYEWKFLRNKVIERTRDWSFYFGSDFTLREAKEIVNPLFVVVLGDIEPWEKVREI